MKKIVYILFISLFCVLSCKKKDVELSTVDQTVFMYLPWSTNLTPYFYQNIADFETAITKGILKNERLIVFFATDNESASLFEIKSHKGESSRKTLKNYNSSTFTTSEGITALLNDVKRFAPAKRYAMIIGSHGLGWLPVGFSDSRASGQKDYWDYEGDPLTRLFGGTTSEYQIDVTTFAKGIADAGIKMEYILFDDCYMSSIEVAYDLKDVTQYLMASPTEMMAYGLPYADIARYLIGNVDYYKVCKGFLSFYQNFNHAHGTIALTDCSQLDNMAAVMKEINENYSFDESQIGSLQIMGGYTPTIFFDYGDYVSKLCTDDELLAKFNAQLELTVPPQCRLHTPSHYTMAKGPIYINSYSGITTSDPSVNVKAASKTETAWYKATH